MSKAPLTVCLLGVEPSVLKAVGRLLASEVMTSEPSTEPVRFLACAQSHDVPVAVLDVRMPGMNGFALQSALRAVCPPARIMVITAESDPIHRDAALAGGARRSF